MPTGHEFNLLDEDVPIFPLPNLVLFPRAVLPLHIFEERYRRMMADALTGRRLLAMALLRPGWTTDYHGAPPIEPVVCVGEVLTHELLPDGKYNLLLQGRLRATVVRETSERPYRLATLAAMEEQVPAGIDFTSERADLAALLARREMRTLRGIEQFRDLAAGLLPLPELTDLIAFHLLDDVEVKQALLAEPDIAVRVRRTIITLASLAGTLPVVGHRGLGKPSMN